jgi:hypothetical protein
MAQAAGIIVLSNVVGHDDDVVKFSGREFPRMVNAHRAYITYRTQKAGER